MGVGDNIRVDRIFLNRRRLDVLSVKKDFEE